MWKQHGFETIFTSNDVMNIQDYIGKEFGSREISYPMGVNSYFGSIKTNRPHAARNYGRIKSKFEI